MFSHITANWRGKPLVSHEVIVNLIGNTTTKTGLRIQADLDRQSYRTGIQISEQDVEELNLENRNSTVSGTTAFFPTKLNRLFLRASLTAHTRIVIKPGSTSGDKVRLH